MSHRNAASAPSTALKRLLLRESQVQPLLLVFEDLHWIDTETQALLDSLVESLPTARLLLLVNYRPEYQHSWGNKTYYTQLRLDPLPPVSARTFLQTLLGDDPSLAPLKQRLIDRTQGNPFFLEESVRTLVETRGLVGDAGRIAWPSPRPSIQVPPTVQAVLAARIDRLPPEEKRLLQTAAVIGTEVPLPLLQAIAEVPEAIATAGLAHLQAAEFLYETRLFPEHEYTFKHALTQQVAYESLLQERRRALHARIVEALEALAGDRVAEQVERLAHHALRGEVWDKALAYCRQAGEKTLARSAHREAVGYFEQALSALAHLPEERDTREQAIDLRLALRSALCRLATWGVSWRVCARPRPSPRPSTSRVGWDRSLLFLSVHCHLMGAHDQAIAAAQRALALATAGGDVVLQRWRTAASAIAYEAQGDYRRAIDCYRQTVASLDRAQRHERFGQVFLPAVESCARLAWGHAELGTFPEGRALGEEGLRIAEAVAHPASLMLASWGIGLLALRQGDLPRALPRLERAVRICQDADLPLFFPWMAGPWVRRIPWPDALPTLCRCSRRRWSRVLRRKAYTTRRSVVSPWVKRSCWPAAWRRRTPSPSARWRSPVSTRNVATRRMPCASSATSRRGASFRSVEQAEAYYQQALALAEELGMRPLQAHCHLASARCMP